ncbi:MAG: IS5 family transposase [Rubrobacteraceae bacterium]
MPAIRSYFIEPIWEQFRALLPQREVDHPLGCHRPRVPDRVVFEQLLQVLVFDCAYWRISDESCSDTTLRRRRDEWIDLGVMDALRELVLEAYDHFVGLELSEVAVDGCITKAPCGGEKAGRSPVDRGKRGLKRSTAVDANGIPVGTVTAPANRHDSPLLAETLDAVSEALGGLPERASIHLDRGYDSKATRERLRARGLLAEIPKKGKPAPLGSTNRWVVERTNSWHNAHKKLVWCTERRGRVIAFWVAFSDVIVIVRRLIREAWSRYRWEARPPRKP